MQKVSCADLDVGVTQHSDRPAVASTYAIAGRFISIECPDEDSAKLFRHYFSGWHVTPVSDADDIQPHVTIVVRGGAPPNAPARLPPFEVAEGGICHTDGTTYFFQNNSSAVFAGNSDSPRIEVWIGRTEPTRERKALARLIFNAVMTAMRRCGLYEVHAAGVVAPDGTGILITGPSGSGKSTFATQLASIGWQYLSDDSLLIYENESMIEAHALRRVFAVTGSSVATTPELDRQLADTIVEPFDPNKRRFEPGVVFPNRFAARCTPRKLFFSCVTEEPSTRSRSLSPADTMKQLLRMCPWAAYDKAVAVAHLQVLARLAKQAVGFELLAGRDLLGDPEFAAGYLLKATN